MDGVCFMEHPDVEKLIGQIDERTQQMNKNFKEFKDDIKKLLFDNGQPGLVTKVGNLESDIKSTKAFIKGGWWVIGVLATVAAFIVGWLWR